ncbi:MAG: hypothetical protein H0X37_25190 [Herpetosiphonaceae bacterium]|nr:hypothetical protein [Herpetosiphonaceae bacterium]
MWKRIAQHYLVPRIAALNMGNSSVVLGVFVFVVNEHTRAVCEHRASRQDQTGVGVGNAHVPHPTPV